MLHAAVVPVDGKPIFELILVGEALVVVRVDVAQEVPGRACPLGHGVRLALGGCAALRAGAVDKGIYLCKRALAALAGLEVLDLGELERKLVFGHCYHAAVRAVDNRNRLAPIALAVERPVLHLILNALFAYAALLEEHKHLLYGFLFVVRSVEEIGVYHLTVAGVGLFFNVAALDDLNDVYAEGLCKIPVALIVGGNRHNSARAVAHHDIVGDENRDPLAVDGVNRGETVELDACLVLDELSALELGLFAAFCAVFFDLVHIRDALGIFIDERMLGSHDHKRDSEKGVGAGGVYAHGLIRAGEGEVDERAGRAAYPILLLSLDVGGEIDVLEPVEELVGVFGYAQKPDVL